MHITTFPVSQASPVVVGRWSDEDHQRLTELAGTMKPDEIAAQLGRTEHAIRNRARVFGISIALGNGRQPWTTKEVDYLYQHYQRLTVPAMAKHLGRTRHSVAQKCRDLDLDCKIYGYKNHKTVYSSESVAMCRELFAAGLTRRQIADKLDVPYQRVCMWVLNRERTVE